MGATWRRSAAVVALGVGTVTLVFAGGRLLRLDSDPSAFAVAGSQFVDPAQAPDDLRIWPGVGYDGQFVYRLALDPWTVQETDHGITLDAPAYRQQRILLPALAWGLSGGGRASSISWSLIAVNVAAAAVLAGVVAVRARKAGRSVWWGGAVALAPAAAVSVARDLPEVLALTLLASALVLRPRRPWVAGGLLGLAVLARETTVLVAVAFMIVWLWRRGRGREPGYAGVWFVPIVVAVAWQVELGLRWGILPVAAGSEGLGPPLLGMARAVDADLAVLTGTGLLQILLMAAVLAFGVVSAAAVRGSQAPVGERVALVLALSLTVCLSVFVWEDHHAFLRATGEVFLVGGFVLLGHRARWATAGILAGPACWLIAAGMLVRAP